MADESQAHVQRVMDEARRGECKHDMLGTNLPLCWAARPCCNIMLTLTAALCAHFIAPLYSVMLTHMRPYTPVFSCPCSCLNTHAPYFLMHPCAHAGGAAQDEVVALGIRAAQEFERNSEVQGRYKGKATDAQSR